MSVCRVVRVWTGVILALLATAAWSADEPLPRALGYRDAVEILLRGNRDIRLARRAVEAADAARVAAGARPNPNLSVGATAFDPAGPGSGALWNKSMDSVVQLTQLVERGGKRALRDEAAGYLAEAARDALADAVRVQVRALAARYYDLLRAQERVRIADDTLALFAKTLAAARLRLAAGDIAPSDLSRLNVDALRAENDRRQAQADRDRVRADLALALGLEGDAVPLAAVDAWPAGADATFPADMEAVAGRRADVLAARRRADAFDRFRALAQSLRTRDVTVAAQVERYPGQPHANTVGVGVTVPLFINYEFDGEIRRAEADRAAAEEAFALAKGAAITEIRQAWSDLAAARDRVRRYDGALLAEAARAADAAAFAYRNGALGVIDLLDAQRTLVATQVDAVTARADLAKALAAWRAAIAAVEDIP